MGSTRIKSESARRHADGSSSASGQCIYGLRLACRNTEVSRRGRGQGKEVISSSSCQGDKRRRAFSQPPTIAEAPIWAHVHVVPVQLLLILYTCRCRKASVVAARARSNTSERNWCCRASDRCNQGLTKRCGKGPRSYSKNTSRSIVLTVCSWQGRESPTLSAAAQGGDGERPTCDRPHQ